MPRFHTRAVVKLSCALGLASLTSLLAFLGAGVVCRKETSHRREVCRRFAAKVLESRLGQP
jgi:hypothetical protein